MERLNLIDWGTIPYQDAYNNQKDLFEDTIQKKLDEKQTSNVLIFCEHPHVITIGKNGLDSNLLYPEVLLKAKNVSLYHVDRGGDITYHGPGQLVGYPILDLDSLSLSLKRYVYLVEEGIIQLLSLYGIKGNRLEGATGVWLDTHIPEKTRKICAIGVRSSRFVTMHGFALNINTDLSYFQLINPCGFIDKGVTSIEKETGKAIDITIAKKQLFEIFSSIFK